MVLFVTCYWGWGGEARGTVCNLLLGVGRGGTNKLNQH